MPGLAAALSPVVTIEPASDVGVTTAHVQGSVDPEGKHTSWHFEYVTQADFEATEWAAANQTLFGEGDGEDPIDTGQQVLEFLTPNTTYHLRLVAENEDGQAQAVASTFKTDPATAPAVSIEPVTELSFTKAKLSGKVDPEGGNSNPVGGPVPIVWQFEYREVGAGDWSYAGSGEISASEPEGGGPIPALSTDPIDVEVEATGLQPGKPYEARLIAFYANLQAESPTKANFETLAVDPPVLTIDDASSVTGTSAHFSGSVEIANADPAFDSRCRFEYVTDAQFQINGFEIASKADCNVDPIKGPGTTQVEADVFNLAPDTTYHLRLVTHRAATASTNLSAEAVASNFTTPEMAPDIGDVPSVPLSDSSVRIRGLVSPYGSPISDCLFEYGEPGDLDQSTPCDQDPGGGNDAVLVSADVEGLQPATDYQFRLVATSGVGTTEGEPQVFKPFSAPEPSAAGSLPGQGFLPNNRAWEMVTPAEGKNGADVVPASMLTLASEGGSDFLFTTLSPFGDAIGAGLVSQYIAKRNGTSGTSGWQTHGVTPKQPPLSFSDVFAHSDARYLDDKAGPDFARQVIQTRYPLTDDPDVANAANLYLRDDTLTPGSGSYELISSCPACSDGEPSVPDVPLPVTVTFERRPILAGVSAGRDRVTFTSRSRLTADAPGGGESVLYEWERDPLSEVQEIAVDATGGTYTLAYGGKATAPIAFDAPASIVQSRLESISGIGLGNVTVSGGPGGSSPYEVSFQAALADANVRPLVVDTALLSGGAASATVTTTTAGGSQLRLAGKIPPAPLEDNASCDGSTAVACESAPVSYPGLGPGNSKQNALSDGSDGHSRAFFTFPTQDGSTPTVVTGGLGRLYMRRDGSFTTEISATEKSSPEVFRPAGFTYATPDGKHVFFTSGSQLTDEPGTGLYRYTDSPDPDSEQNLTLISRDSEPQDGLGVGTEGINSLMSVLGSSDDGGYVYFSANVDLTEDGASASEANCGGNLGWCLYMWHDGDLKYLARVQDSGGRLNHSVQIGTLRGLKRSRVSPDGHRLLFTALGGRLTGYDHGAACETYGHQEPGCAEFYLYDATVDQLTCASCIPSGATPTTDAENWGARERGFVQVGQHYSRLSRALSADGRYAFFETKERLLPLQDTNGQIDVYEYDLKTGKQHLLSSGQSSSPSYFMTASVDGSDAFFVTRERLSGWDRDNSQDVYTAHAGGGFPEPPLPPAACEGDSCQGAPRIPTDPTPGSATVSGPPSPRPDRGKRCRKASKAKAGKRGKSSCAKKTGQKKKAGTTGRTGR